MKVSKTEIEGVFIIEPQVFEDERGYFFESYNKEKLKEQGIDYDFIQDNQSKSKYGTIRGIHFQKGEYAQAKLVRVLEGTVLDVAVDLRKDSPTFGKHVAVELSAENRRQLMIPRGFGHGFSVLSETAVFAYKCDNVYNKASEGGLRYNDPKLGIDWKIDTDKAILSDKDKVNPLLEEIECF
ncbi:MAG: dTDP-4-dehydrorhamnose 3,5-epimerase [Alphaproteobacteria bacterium]|nr:dTDP-4-dehydrorhamnose 3,5-epimerase [Alphaproteobacteria bacterium]MBQ8784423.1 dTDP-4-dehydrorhamnose 3,5-epimerase [Alphaproteobacteria bacterium]